MNRDTRLSRMLHVLIHMDQSGSRINSETISMMLGTNSAVVRRTMGGLRRAGYVRSVHGPGGGWELTTSLSDVSLLDIYRSVGEPPLFAIGPSNDQPDCLVERAVDARIDEALEAAKAVIVEEFARISVADIARDFESHYSTSQSCE